MKVLCPSCERLVELVDLRVERGALVFRCPACRADHRQALPSGSSPSLVARSGDDDENDEGPTIILLTPGSDGGPLAIAPPGASPLSRIPAPVARFDRPGPTRPARNLTSVPVPRQAVDAEFANLLDQLDGVHPPPPKAPPPPLGAPVLPSTPGVTRGSTVQIPPGHCPKCIAPRTREATLCPACGLVFANFRASDHQPSAVLESAWYSLAERWDRSEEHEKFLQLAFNLDELAQAGRLYRIRLAQTPDDAQSKKALEGMVRMASTAASLAARTDPAELARRRRKVLALTAMLFVVLPLTFLLLNILFRTAR